MVDLGSKKNLINDFLIRVFWDINELLESARFQWVWSDQDLIDISSLKSDLKFVLFSKLLFLTLFML